MGRPTRVKPLPAGTSRRGFFTKSGSAALALATPPMLAIAHDDDGDDDARTGGVAFDCGVASGDPLRDRVILWTRVTPSRPARGVLVRYVVGPAKSVSPLNQPTRPDATAASTSRRRARGHCRLRSQSV